MASASSDNVGKLIAELQGYVEADRSFRIEAYTFARWAEWAESSDSYAATRIQEWADLHRAVTIQWYTFRTLVRSLLGAL